MHGFLSIVALALNLATVVSVMIPTLITSSLSTMNCQFCINDCLAACCLWHLAIILGLAVIVSWILHPLGELGCSKTWRLMMPTFLIWALSLVLGVNYTHLQYSITQRIVQKIIWTGSFAVYELAISSFFICFLLAQTVSLRMKNGILHQSCSLTLEFLLNRGLSS